ncbi:MAG: conserved phage C-terminal domain-containing protein [Candidatus Omnitrophica bacterium]|nr:conserved phage C-terminal domain-containing protein [Candidatus Omnitrophota bacterium]
MILTQEEILTILKKALPKENYKHLDDIATTIKNKGKRWQENGMDEYIQPEIVKTEAIDSRLKNKG